MKKKQIKKERIPQRPKLYWLYVTYLVCAGFLFPVFCIGLFAWITQSPFPYEERNSFADIIRESRLSFLSVFLFISILWIFTLFFVRRKNTFYRKWLTKSICVLLLVLVFVFGITCLEYAYHEEILPPEPPCFDCCEGCG